jgi:cell division protein FtsB
MDVAVIKRKIKSKLSGKKTAKKTNKKSKKPSFFVLSAGVMCFVLIVFCIVQLLVVSVLSPRGKELKRLDSEKEVLLEENRKLEQEIAEYTSLSLIKNRAESQLEMSRPDDVMYVTKPSANAEAQ